MAEAGTAAAAAASTIRPYLSSYDPQDQANDADDVRMMFDCYVDNDLHLFVFEASVVVAAALSHWAHFVVLSAIDHRC